MVTTLMSRQSKTDMTIVIYTFRRLPGKKLLRVAQRRILHLGPLELNIIHIVRTTKLMTVLTPTAEN